MTYDAQEGSVADGRPYFLYQFSDSAGTTYLTSEPISLFRAGQTWEPESISHDNIEVTGNIEKNDITLEFPLSSTFAQTLLLPPTSIMTLTIFRGHHSDLTEETRAYWKGRIVGAKSGRATIQVTSESIYTSLRRAGCTARIQRSCRHALYLPGCNVNKDSFAVVGIITAMSGLTLTVPNAALYPDGRFKAGMLNFNGNWGFITSHVSSTLVLVSEIVGLEDYIDLNGSAPTTMYPGCDRSEGVCHGLFNNIANFGGFSRRPKKNPFSGSII